MRMAALLLAMVWAISSLPAADLTPDCSAVPGWTQKGEPREYVPDDLFDYMDGNAEGYIIYGFQKMTGVSCTSGGDTIHLDYFRMESPEMAWGIFTANRHPRYDTVAAGTIGQIMPRRSAFVKGSYYVELAANQDALDAMRAFVRALEPKVSGATSLPEPLRWFPEEGLDKASIRLVPQSVLGLRMLKRGYLAKYADGRAFIVFENSPGAAATVIDQFKGRFGDWKAVETVPGAITGKDRYLGRMCVTAKGRYIVGFATRSAGADLTGRTAAIAANIP